jgi:hypothetical protein
MEGRSNKQPAFAELRLGNLLVKIAFSMVLRDRSSSSMRDREMPKVSNKSAAVFASLPPL